MVAPEGSVKLQAHPQQTMEISLAFIGSAFLAGLLTFLAPCTLPLVPAYLGFISGVDVSDEVDSLPAEKHRKIIANAAMFVIGFSAIFILFGMLAGLVGQALAQWRIWLTRISGIFIILFGIVMVFDISPSIFASKNLRLPNWAKSNNPFSSFLLGGAFAFGWTPCVGPILGSILALASQQATVLSGGLLLAVFSLGLALPFLGLAVFYARFSGWIKHSKFWLQAVSRIGGVFLILLGLLLITNNFSLLIQYGYDWFEFLNYESIEQYL